jgi:hypothetical protein
LLVIAAAAAVLAAIALLGHAPPAEPAPKVKPAAGYVGRYEEHVGTDGKKYQLFIIDSDPVIPDGEDK